MGKQQLKWNSNGIHLITLTQWQPKHTHIHSHGEKNKSHFICVTAFQRRWYNWGAQLCVRDSKTRCMFFLCSIVNFDCAPWAWWHGKGKRDRDRAKVRGNCMCTIEFNSRNTDAKSMDTLYCVLLYTILCEWQKDWSRSSGTHTEIRRPTTIALRIKLANEIIFISKLVT